MRPLNAERLLETAERIRSEPLPRRGAALLAAANGTSMDEALSLTIGERDARLVALRQVTFGRELTGVADCPQCHERCELTLDSAMLDLGPTVIDAIEVQIDGARLRARLPNGHDVAAVIGASDPRRALLARCIVDATQELSDETMTAIEVAMEHADPRADLRLALTCPTCAHAWTIALDIVAFLAAEIRTAASRLIDEVHLLARAYGWREADILAMSAYRRQMYLERASA
jgi:hypothetical protein